jgi:hypothetical protein
MQGCQIDIPDQGCFYLLSDKNTRFEHLSPVDHPVTDSVDFFQTLYTPVFCTSQDTEDVFNACLVIDDFAFEKDQLPIGSGMLEKRAFHPQFFNSSFGDNVPVGHVKKLVFDGTASAVEN